MTIQNNTIAELPPDIDSSGWPSLRLIKLRLRDYLRHEDIEVDFSDKDKPLDLACLVGFNGSGKTTILHAIQLLFNNFNGYTPERFRALMAKSIRNPDGSPCGTIGKGFVVEGRFLMQKAGWNPIEYDVIITSNEIVSHHHPEISKNLSHYCYFANFDMQLNQFVLKRSRWEQFQSFFSNMTGFPVREMDNVFDQSMDEEYSDMLNKYVLGFHVEKPDETITQRQCSAGEKKIIKCFSTVLNRPVQPSIILIDNVTDHIEINRHLGLMNHLPDCFPNSQLITTCHSIPVQKNYPDRSKILDMRVLYAPDYVSGSTWRLRLKDEIKDIADALYSCQEDVSELLVQAVRVDQIVMDPRSTPEQAVKFTSEFMEECAPAICRGRVGHSASRLSTRKNSIVG